MPTDLSRATRFLKRLLSRSTAEQMGKRLESSDESLSPRLTAATRITPHLIERRWQAIGGSDAAKAELLDDLAIQYAKRYTHNIENFIGTAKVPLGIAGPLRMQGLFAQGDYYIPMATTEAALVASCTRGSQAISRAGGAIVAVINEGVGRSPAFAFKSFTEAGRFVAWVTDRFEQIHDAAQTTTRHGKLVDLKVSIQGNHVYLLLEYEVGEAAGQNMVTIATDAACRWIVKHSPIAPAYWFVEANMSGDKKVTAQSFLSVRGKKVIAEVVLPARLVAARFHTTVDQMMNYYQMSALGGVMSGAMGIQGHYANALAAVFIACGQDAACVAEAATGITRFEKTDAGDLYAAVTMPNLIVGVVGGGTGLPSARACIDILKLPEKNPANAFAEVCAALVLAGELSIIGSLAAGDFAAAHQRLARGQADLDDISSPQPDGDTD